MIEHYKGNLLVISVNYNKDAAKSGDESNPMIWTLMLIGAFAIAGTFAVRRKLNK